MLEIKKSSDEPLVFLMKPPLFNIHNAYHILMSLISAYHQLSPPPWLLESRCLRIKNSGSNAQFLGMHA